MFSLKTFVLIHSTQSLFNKKDTIHKGQNFLALPGEKSQYFSANKRDVFGFVFPDHA